MGSTLHELLAVLRRLRYVPKCWLVLRLDASDPARQESVFDCRHRPKVVLRSTVTLSLKASVTLEPHIQTYLNSE